MFESAMGDLLVCFRVLLGFKYALRLLLYLGKIVADPGC